MITEKDMKILRYRTSRLHKIVLKYFFPVCILLFIIAVTINLLRASEYASKEGLSLIDVICKIENINFDERYSGVFLKSVERLSTAAIESMAVIGIFTIWFIGFRETRLSKRILHFIETSKAQ